MRGRNRGVANHAGTGLAHLNGADHQQSTQISIDFDEDASGIGQAKTVDFVPIEQPNQHVDVCSPHENDLIRTKTKSNQDSSEVADAQRL